MNFIQVLILTHSLLLLVMLSELTSLELFMRFSRTMRM